MFGGISVFRVRDSSHCTRIKKTCEGDSDLQENHKKLIERISMTKFYANTFTVQARTLNSHYLKYSRIIILTDTMTHL